MRKTKIICTLGPACDDPKILKELMLNGMDVARMNFSHGTHEEHMVRLRNVKKIRAQLGKYVATMLDTKGPEIRIGTFKDGKITINTDDTFILTTRDVEGDNTQVHVQYKDFVKDVKVGTKVLFSDGALQSIVERIDGEDVYVRFLNSGKLSDRKSINLPDVKLSMPFLSEADKRDILFGIENDFDFIALSFTRCKEDVLSVKEFLAEHGGSNIRIIAKIENKEGVDKLDEIIEVSDAIMVARGDMGVEIDYTKIPKIQKDMIDKCYKSGKPVITATQMLESMVESPRPTRAEVTDIANAIYDNTSAIMLSGETASGKYPLEALKAMAAIAEETENTIDYSEKLRERSYNKRLTVTDSVAHGACMTAMDIGAKAIVTVTETGFTARNISKYRPSIPIIGCTTTERSCRHLSLSWGVIPLLMRGVSSTDELIEVSVAIAQHEGILQDDDLVVVTAGVPIGVSGSTNIIKVHTVGQQAWQD